MEHDDQELHAFLDTNVYLHYTFFAEVDWPKVLGASRVVIVVPPQVFRELDKRKTDQSRRTQARATSVARRFADMLRSGDYELRPGVRIEALAYEPLIDFKALRLSEHSPDDHLLASMVEYRDEKHIYPVLVTADNLLELKAGRLGIRVVPMPEGLRLQHEDDPAQKRIRELEAEVAAFKSAQPVLRLGFRQNGKVLAVQIDAGQPLSEAEIEEKMSRLREQYPLAKRLEVNPSSLARTFDALIVSDEDIAFYNKELAGFFGRYRDYLELLHAWRTARPLAIALPLKLENVGQKPAEDTDVVLTLPDDIAACFKLRRRAKPKEPKPPERPRSNPYGLHGLDVVGNFPRMRTVFDEIVERQSNVGSWALESERSARVHVQRVKQHDPLHLPALYAAFPSRETVESFRLAFVLKCASLPAPVENALHVKINRPTD